MLGHVWYEECEDITMSWCFHVYTTGQNWLKIKVIKISYSEFQAKMKQVEAEERKLFQVQFYSIDVERLFKQPKDVKKEWDVCMQPSL